MRANPETKASGILAGKTEMEFKRFNYTVVQTTHPTGWKWTVWLDEKRTRSGTAFSRASAVVFAQQAIEKIIKGSGGFGAASTANRSVTAGQAN